MNYLDKFKLNNKTAYIIGGLGLIGYEVSKALKDAGAKVIILDNDKQKYKKIKNNKLDKIIFEYFDVTKLKKNELHLKNILNKYNKVDIVVNTSYPRTSDLSKNNFDQLKIESLNENIKIHLNSYIFLSKIFAENMKKNKSNGSIIHLSSIYGLVAQDLNIYKKTNMRENITYAAIKGGINNATKTFASYYGKYNIRVNNLAPGGLLGHVAGKSLKQNKNFILNYSSKVPLKRLGNAEEVASAALFLSSDASSYITGSTLIVDGGWTAI